METLSTSSVLAQTDGGKTFFAHVMRGPIEIKKKYKNPFYQDTKPALRFSLPNGRWMFKDFGDDAYCGDVFTFAGFYYNLNPRTQLNEIIERMAGDLHLTNGMVSVASSNGKGANTNASTITPNTTITLTPGKDYKESTDKNRFKIWYEYADKGQIDEVLQRYHVRALEWFKRGNLTVTNSEYPIFAIPFGKAFKIYQPGHQQYKGSWLGDKGEGAPVYGVTQLPAKCEQILIVEGPLTDMVVAAAYGYNVIAIDNAQTKLPKDLIAKLKQKADKIILCLDNDEAGIRAMKKLTAEHQIPYLVLPKTFKVGDVEHSDWGSDISDFFRLGQGGDAKPFIEYFNFLLVHSVQLPKPSKLLQAILDTQAILMERVKKKIEFVPPLIKHNEDDLFYPNSLNIIQGHEGSHKSRFAGDLASVLINKKMKANISGMIRASLYTEPIVCYIDTERPLKDSFPYGMQQIILRAGYTLETIPTRKFQFCSFINTPRKERQDAIQQYIERVRLSTKKHVVFILDVVTDMLGDFNEVAGTFQLIDYLNVLINRFEVTFFLIIHENPGNTTSNKARGHVGTEAANKASSIVQIKREQGTNIINVNALKVRHGRPDVSYCLKWDDETKGLVEATGEDVALAMASKDSKDLIPSEALTLIAQIITRSDTPTLNRGDLEKAIQELYEKQTGIKLSDRTVRRRIDVFAKSKNPATIQHSDGKTYQLLIDKKGNTKMFSLQEKTTENDEDLPF